MSDIYPDSVYLPLSSYVKTFPFPFKPFDVHCWHVNWGTAIKHPMADRVKPPFVTFDIRARKLWRSECPVVKNYMDGLNHTGIGCFVAVPSIHMATVGVKGFISANSQNKQEHEICSASPKLPEELVESYSTRSHYSDSVNVMTMIV